MPTLLQFITQLEAPAERCFRLSLHTGLHAASMNKHRETIVAGVTNTVMQLHDTVTWKSFHFGMPIYMRSRIQQYMLPYYFTDEMQRGPFRHFRHQHLFQVQSDNSTIMTDIIEYELPLGILGKWADRAFIKNYLQQLILERNRFLRQTAESDAWRQFLD